MAEEKSYTWSVCPSRCSDDRCREALVRQIKQPFWPRYGRRWYIFVYFHLCSPFSFQMRTRAHTHTDARARARFLIHAHVSMLVLDWFRVDCKHSCNSGSHRRRNGSGGSSVSNCAEIVHKTNSQICRIIAKKRQRYGLYVELNYFSKLNLFSL